MISFLKTKNFNEKKFEDQLLQNYEFYKSAFELSKDPKLVLEDCVIIRFNPATLNFFECDDPDALYMHKLNEFFVGEINPPNVLSEQCDGNVFIETDIRTCSGKIIPVAINFDTISKNIKQQTIVTIKDISEKISSIKKLKESNEFIYKVMDNLPLGIGVKTIDHHTIKYMNENFCKIWGWPKEVVADFNKFFDSAYPSPGEAEKIKNMVLESLTKNKLVRWDIVKIKDQEDQDRLLDITMFLMEEQDNMITMVQNVTQEVKDRAWLKVKSEAIKALPNGVVITDIEGKIIWANPAFTREYGYELAEIKGQTPRILKSGTHDKEFYEDMWSTILQGKVWKGKVVNKRKDGSIFDDLQLISPVRSGGAEITHFIAIKNLTEQELDYNVK